MRRRCQYLGSSRPATHSVQSRPSSASTWWPVLAECYRKGPASYSKYLDSRTSQGTTCMGTSTRRTRPMKAHRAPREHLQEFRVHTSESSEASPQDAVLPVARSRRAESKFALATWQSAKIYASAPVMTYRLCIKSILITQMRATSTTINVRGIFSPSIAGHRRHKYRQSRRQVRARRKRQRPGFLRCPPAEEATRRGGAGNTRRYSSATCLQARHRPCLGPRP